LPDTREAWPLSTTYDDLAIIRGKALLESEARFRRLLESVTSYVYTVTVHDGHAVSTVHHDGCETVTGFSPAEFAAEPYLWYMLVHPDDRPKVLEMAREILAGARNLSLVHRIRHKDGRFRWVRNLLVPHFDEEGTLVSYDGIINDISERKEIEESRIASERNLRLIMENSHDIIFSMDRSGRLLAGNSAFIRMISDLTGGRAIASGETVPLDGLPDRLHSQWQRYFERAIAGERVETILPLRLRDGVHTMECVFNPIASDGSAVEGVAAFIHDVTERTQAQKAVSTIVRCMARTTGLASLDVMAEGLEKWLEAEGVVIGEFLDDGSRIRIHSARLGGRAVPDTPYTIGAGFCRRIVGEQLCFHPKHGPWVFPEESGPAALCMDSHLGVPIRNSYGAAVGILCAVSRHPFKAVPASIEIMEVMAAKAGAEIERVRNEKALQDLCDQKEIMLRETHHRVKNNLQIISSLIRLQSIQVQDADSASAIVTIGNRIQSMALIHEVLYDATSLDSSGFAEYVGRLCRYLASAYCPEDGRIRVANRVSGVNIGLDQAILCGLIINELVTNSFKYAFPDQRRGTITVELVSDGEESLSLRIADDGVGLPEGFLPEKAESLGMVLISCLTRQLGGILRRECGDGTAFVVRFPIAKVEESKWR
jgi:PAS domain S-box-containing protein